MKFNLGKGFTIFVLFFGVAVLEAFRTRDWMSAGFWVLIALLFLFVDLRDSFFAKQKKHR